MEETEARTLVLAATKRIYEDLVAHVTAKVEPQFISLGDSLIVGEDVWDDGPPEATVVVDRQIFGLEATWVAPGGFVERSVMKVRAFEVPSDEIGFHLVLSPEERVAGKAVDMLVSKGSEELIHQVDLRLDAITADGAPLDDAVIAIQGLLSKEFTTDNGDWHVIVFTSLIAMALRPAPSGAYPARRQLEDVSLAE